MYVLTSKCASRHNGMHFFDISTVVRTWCFLYIFTCKCASRHNGVHFFDIATSKSCPTLRCFVHFHFEMCFAPQRRALFRHRNFQKWSDTGVLHTLTWKCALRHNGVQFFISHLAPLERAYFSTLRSPKSLEKHSVLRLSYLFNPPASFPYRIGTPRCCIKRFFYTGPPSISAALFALFWRALILSQNSGS